MYKSYNAFKLDKLAWSRFHIPHSSNLYDVFTAKGQRVCRQHPFLLFVVVLGARAGGHRGSARTVRGAVRCRAPERRRDPGESPVHRHCLFLLSLCQLTYMGSKQYRFVFFNTYVIKMYSHQLRASALSWPPSSPSWVVVVVAWVECPKLPAFYVTYMYKYENKIEILMMMRKNLAEGWHRLLSKIF